MSGNGHKFKYSFGMKNQWRREIHNRIVERLDCKPSEAVVLYLAGPEDLDRPEFIRRGFKPNNLISIEKDSTLCEAIRKQGKLCLHGEMLTVISKWRKSRVNVVFGDFCSGLENSVVELIRQMIANECFARSVCAFNLLRGRDPRTQAIRAIFGASGKHRGKILAKLYGAILGAEVRELESLGLFGNRSDLDNLGVHEHTQRISSQAIENKCWSSEYKSTSGQFFDSCVFTNLTPRSIIDEAFRSAQLDFAASIAAVQMETHCGMELEGVLQRHPAHKRSFLKSKLEKLMRSGVEELTSNFKKKSEGKTCEFDMSERWIKDNKADLNHPMTRQISAIKAVRTMSLAK